ncbi:MAG: Stf0 family sulfotransferase, partial [Gammaproteobacteria bacterium]|nr:Stf0 family sulfotransferase [Gammaproteobacteria bacterium]
SLVDSNVTAPKHVISDRLIRVATDILDYLGLGLSPGHVLKTRHRRLADDLNAQWVDRYRAELTERLAVSSQSGKD